MLFDGLAELPMVYASLSFDDDCSIYCARSPFGFSRRGAVFTGRAQLSMQTEHTTAKVNLQ